MGTMSYIVRVFDIESVDGQNTIFAEEGADYDDSDYSNAYVSVHNKNIYDFIRELFQDCGLDTHETYNDYLSSDAKLKDLANNFYEQSETTTSGLNDVDLTEIYDKVKSLIEAARATESNVVYPSGTSNKVYSFYMYLANFFITAYNSNAVSGNGCPTKYIGDDVALHTVRETIEYASLVNYNSELYDTASYDIGTEL